MTTLSLADAQIVAPVVKFLDRTGANAESYLDRVRIPMEMVAFGGMIAKKQIHDLFFEVAHRERCQAIGLLAYQEFQLSDLGPITAPMQSAKTVKEALEIFTRLANGAYEGNEYSLEVRGNISWLCFRDQDHVSPGYIYSHHVTLMAYLKIIRLIADTSWQPRQLCSHGGELDAFATIDDFKECTSTFHVSQTALALPTELLSRPTLGDADGEFNSSHSKNHESNGQHGFVDSLHRLIASRFLYRKLPTIEQVALITDVSPRTIKRRLAEEGLSYRRLLDRICYDSAHEMLSDRQMTIKNIAQELGYSGTNNFVRGFRRMTGITPTEYRYREFGQ